MSIFQTAKSKTSAVADTLPAFEAACATAFDRTSLPESDVELAIEGTWPTLVDTAEQGMVRCDYHFIHSVYQSLPDAAHAPECGATLKNDPVWQPEHCSVDINNLAILYWDDSFPVLNLTLAWTCMNLFRLRRGQNIIVPRLESLGLFVQGMDDAAPDINDGVALEGLIEEFADALLMEDGNH